ncbi:hypothetical protein HQN87_07375 [Paenibacillus tritici]|jgi:YVTN family beta-propeller protein|uniref:Cell surface protein n=1 Tax=Paenibacillus tritici TaxID=1873425 RepID=A0ABX2DKI8_9BACL|nr:hypothetical protein [Paenibacillus tritici]NQX45148.1 hypothetical protein [Paenibacillus tritici]QUL53184.1 hypothetical protein KDC22_22560 [Paenibacillus tritici]
MNPNKATANRDRTLSSGYPYVYVSYVYDYVAGYVAVIDPVHDEIIRTITVGFDPGPMCLDIEEKRLYVLSSKGSSVTVVDTSTLDVLTSFRVGQSNDSYPVAIFASPLGGKLYIANSGEKTVVIVDTLTNDVIKDVDVGPGKPFAFASNENSNFIYVACKVADGKDYVVAISFEDHIAYPYGKEMELTFYEGLNPLTVHPDGHTQITLGNSGMLVHTDEQIGKPVTSSLLDNTVSGVYLDNKMLLCTTDEGKSIIKQIINLAVDEDGNITFDDYADIPSYKGQDKIRYSRMQIYVGVTIQPTTTPIAAVQLYTLTGINFPLVRFPYVGDLAFSSDTKVYVGQTKTVRPIDLTTARVLPAIPMSPESTDNIQVRNVISGYRNQS